MTWSQFVGKQPDLAEAAHDLFCYFGVGLAFLSTARPDGGPRLHPICVVIADEGLYGLIIPSPKLQDLRRDGRFALHSYPLPDNEDAAYLTGSAEGRESARAAVIDAFLSQPGREGPPLDTSHFADQAVVEFMVDTVLVTRTTVHGDPQPVHSVWKAP